MFPIRDSSPRHSFPIVNYLLIAINIYVFFMQISAGSFEQFIYDYAFIPKEFNLFNPNSYFYVLTSMFMHGGFMHIASNLWFLHIFGDNVEDRMGHLRYLVFYLFAGLAATLAQYFLDVESVIPMIGASGAISGVSGAYFVLFRRSSIEALVPGFGFFTTTELPVVFFLGYWFVLQLVNGFGSFGAEGGGVAWFAHIGGFVFGYIIAKMMRQKDSY